MSHLAVIAPSVLVVIVLYWRTYRVSSAHARIAAQKKQIEELQAWKASVEELLNRNPYEIISLRNGLRKTR